MWDNECVFGLLERETKMSIRRNDGIVTTAPSSRMHQVLSAGLAKQNRAAATGTFTFTKGDGTYPYGSEEYKKFRGFTNIDIYDTITEEFIPKALNPPATYDANYQKEVNEVLLTAIKTLMNKQEAKD